MMHYMDFQQENVIILEKSRYFDTREQATMPPLGEIALTLRVEIKMTPEKQTFFRGFL